MLPSTFTLQSSGTCTTACYVNHLGDRLRTFTQHHSTVKDFQIEVPNQAPISSVQSGRNSEDVSYASAPSAHQHRQRVGGGGEERSSPATAVPHRRRGRSCGRRPPGTPQPPPHPAPPPPGTPDRPPHLCTPHPGIILARPFAHTSAQPRLQRHSVLMN